MHENVLSNLIINQNVGLSSYAFTSLFVGYGQIAFNILPILYVVVHSTINYTYLSTL